MAVFIVHHDFFKILRLFIFQVYYIPRKLILENLKNKIKFLYQFIRILSKKKLNTFSGMLLCDTRYASSPIYILLRV